MRSVLFGRLRPLDYLVFFIAVAASAGSAVAIYAGNSADAGRLRVSVSGPGGNWLYPADAVEVVRVAGPLGDTVIEIGGGGARVVSSPCRNQICVAAMPIYRHGQWIVCLPNQVMARVDSAAGVTDVVDVVSW